ncbi:MAG TPA: Clp protease N-terminal domain-containing protein, partial [Synergistaceae bacterium]|nr:Clp protease N-terminal domain-containing protein [Synergistaceae bacterium]
MDLNRLTQKSQEALSEAQNLAISYGHQEVDGEHLLLALLQQEGGLIPRLLDRMDVPGANLREAVEKELAKRPRISGGSTEQGKMYVTQRLQKLFVQAEAQAKRLKDEYISVEHLFAALLEEGDATRGGKILRSF